MGLLRCGLKPEAFAKPPPDPAAGTKGLGKLSSGTPFVMELKNVSLPAEWTAFQMFLAIVP